MMILALVLAAACAALQAAYGVAEVALVRANPARLAERAQAGDSGATAALAVVAREDRLLAACLVGATLSGVLGVALCSQWFAMHDWPAWIGVLAYAPVVAWVAAVAPHGIGPDLAIPLAGPSARLVRATQIGALPLVAAVEAWARGVSATAGSTRGTALTRRQIVLLFDDAHAGIDPHEQQMIRRMFALPELPVSACMTPLVHVDFVRTEATVRDAVLQSLKNGHSRIVVAEGRVDNIVGVVHARDLLLAPDDHRPVRELMRPVRYVPAKKRVADLIHDMRRERDPFAVVVDEFGGSMGIATIEDLLEEIIGEIRDERDHEESGIRRISDDDWRVDGRVSVDALAHALGRPIPVGDYTTVAGLVLAAMGRIPRAGESVRLGDVQLTVEEATDRAVRRVIATHVRPVPRE